ncbi:MAG: hypothetical protein WBE68_21675 [Candidatus Nitrosopolaris sp.]
MITASQNASAAVIAETHGIATMVAVHHKGHTASKGTSSSSSPVHHKL